jgi:hypothetical protein
MTATENKPTAFRTLTTEKGLVVKTGMTDAEAKALLPQVGTTYARKLLAVRNPSQNQMAWIHKMVIDAGLGKGERQGIPPFHLPNFDKAAKFIPIPTVEGTFVKIKFDMASGQKVAIYRAGYKSKSPGDIVVNDGGFYKRAVYFGRWTADGRFEPAPACTEEVVEFVKFLANDPETVIPECGETQQ